MCRAISTKSRVAHLFPSIPRIAVCAFLTVIFSAAGILRAQPPHGAIVAWGKNDYGQSNVPVPNTGFVAVTAGPYHCLGLKTDGTIVAWGAGGPNQSGFPHFGQSIVPAPNADFIAIAAGQGHSLGLKADGSIVGWGGNSFGQIEIPEPNTEFIGVGANWNHSLGLKANGSIMAWGYNGQGQTSVPEPSSGFVGVAAGYSHSLGLKMDGSIVPWGCEGLQQHNYGQCNVFLPNSGFVALAGGLGHSIGLKDNGSIVAWGLDSIFGVTEVPAPNANFIAIAAGELHSLGLKADGSIVSWGYNGFGLANVPAPNGHFISVAAGQDYSLAIRKAAFGACCDINAAEQGCRDGVAHIDCINADEVFSDNATCAEVVCKCIPNCAGRDCGDDGCGGSCGTCDDGLFCNGVESCDPQDGCVAGITPCNSDTERCDEATDECVTNSIPTVSEWGMVILTLLLLIGAKRAFARAQQPI
jgi:hypothetical protein